MSFSIITVTLNSAKTIADNVNSVARQKNISVQHIIKDGGSKDDTLKVIHQQKKHIKIVESNDFGIYDAMNQGFTYATNKYVGFLNSDDFFCYDYALKDIQDIFDNEKADIVYGNINIINNNNEIIRIWKTGKINNGRLVGMQIPHPAFFVRREVLQMLEQPFDPKYRISSDFKQQLYLINKLNLPTSYLEKTLVTMRSGGASSTNLQAVILGWKECIQSYREVMGVSGLRFVVSKVIRKLTQLRYKNIRAL
jgi:glycosyltransferase